MLCELPPPGDQLYDPPAIEGIAVSVADWPEHTLVSFTDTSGAGVTVITPESTADPQFKVEYVTVYVTSDVGLTVIL